VAELFTDEAGEALSRLADGGAVNAVVLFESSDSALAEALQRVDGLRLVCIDGRPCDGLQDHYAMGLWWATCRALNCDVPFTVPQPHCVEPPTPPRGPFGVVHPGSGGRSKIAPPRDLAHACATQPDIDWLMVVGEADQEAAAALAARMTQPFRIVRRPPLEELAWYLSRAAYYVGSDSGVSHLAGIAGTPGTVFFGPTEPRLWRPLGDSLEIARFTRAEN
jgi:hypothetical protein